MKNFLKDWLIRNTLPRYCYMSFDAAGGTDNNPPPGGSKGNEGNAYTEEEVSKRVEAARRDEKAKLYEELNGLRKAKDVLTNDLLERDRQISTLNQQIETLTKEKDGLQAKHDALVAAQKADGSVDTEKLIKEVTQRISHEYEQASGKTMNELKKELAELREQKRLSDLALYKREKIASAGEEIVTELVRGNTTEEIDRSVEEAKEAYKKYIKKLGGGNQPPPAPSGGGTPPPPPPGSPSGGQPPASGPLDGFTRPRSREDYAKNREKILESVRQRFK